MTRARATTVPTALEGHLRLHEQDKLGVSHESADSSMVELCALLIMRIGTGCVVACFYQSRDFLERPREASGGFSVRFFCELALVACALACAMKAGLVLYSNWFEKFKAHGSASDSQGGAAGGDDDVSHATHTPYMYAGCFCMAVITIAAIDRLSSIKWGVRYRLNGCLAQRSAVVLRWRDCFQYVLLIRSIIYWK